MKALVKEARSWGSISNAETVNLLDGDYELVPANTTTPESVSLNYTDLNQDPNQCSEEPKATFEQCPRRY